MIKLGLLQIEIYIPQSGSLKRKRYVLRGLKEKIRSKFNVSVAEAGYQDKWQRSVLAIACVSNDDRIISATFSKILDMIEAGRDGYEILRDEIEIL
ncbi:MAG TPA: DUF503 domain-containing protein [Candidatus Goldiibacteriota bacterium]|nr:DUF503 domain-containing protein [Candidatus Goldiibacteriota bacterium]